MKISKSIVYKITDFNTLQNIGASWIYLFQQFIPQSAWLERSVLLSLWISNFNIKWLTIPSYIITILLAFKYYFMIWFKWKIAKNGINAGLYEAQQQYAAKSQHLSPYEKQHRDQLIAIGNALGIKSNFTEL